MIIRSTQIKVGEDQTPEQVCLTEFNHKERRRAFDENNLEEEIYPIYQSMRVLPPDIGYPQIENNWPGFFDEVRLPHLAAKFKPFDLAEEGD